MSNEKDPIILTNYAKVSKLLISTAVLLTLIYFTWWLNINNAGHPVLYTFLVVGEIFHVAGVGLRVYYIQSEKNSL